MSLPSLEAILLAAGRSRRMAGANKLLLSIGGEPLVRRSAAIYHKLAMPLIVVVNRENAELIASALGGIDCRLVVHAGADDGPASSVRAGLAASPLAADGVIIALADLPLLTPGDISALAASFGQAGCSRIAIPRHRGQRGNPVILPAAVARLLAAADAASPRAYIEAHPEAVLWHDTTSEAFVRDIDTREDAILLGVAL